MLEDAGLRHRCVDCLDDIAIEPAGGLEHLLAAAPKLLGSQPPEPEHFNGGTGIGEPDAHERRRHANRHHEYDGERERPAFVERRENEEDDAHRDREHHHRGVATDESPAGQAQFGAAGFLFEVGQFGPFVGHGLGGEFLFGESFHREAEVAVAHAGCDVPVHGSGGIGVVARDDLRPTAFANGRHGGERHHVAMLIPHLDLANVVHAVAVALIGLYVHLPGASEAVEVVDVLAAHAALKGRGDVGDFDAASEARRPVDVEINLRRVRFEDREHAAGLGEEVGLVHEVAGLHFERDGPGVAAVFDHDAESAGAAEPGHRGCAEHVHLSAGNPSRELGLQALDDLRGIQVRMPALGEVFQDDEHRPEVRAVGAEHERIAADSVRVCDRSRAANPHAFALAFHLLGTLLARLRGDLHLVFDGDLGNLLKRLDGAFGGSGIGKLDARDEVAFVLRRDEAGGDRSIAVGARHQEPSVAGEHE